MFCYYYFDILFYFGSIIYLFLSGGKRQMFKLNLFGIYIYSYIVTPKNIVEMTGIRIRAK